MKNEAKRAPGFPISSTFFMAEGRFILHAPSGTVYWKIFSHHPEFFHYGTYFNEAFANANMKQQLAPP